MPKKYTDHVHRRKSGSIKYILKRPAFRIVRSRPTAFFTVFLTVISDVIPSIIMIFYAEIGPKQPEIHGVAASHGSREKSRNSSGRETLKDPVHIRGIEWSK
jgi:hypothetical protein